MSRSPRLLSLAAAAALLATLAACGTATETAGRPGQSTSPTTSAAPTDCAPCAPSCGPSTSPESSAPGVAAGCGPVQPGDAVGVTYARSGGMTGETLRLRFADDAPPPPGKTRADVERVLRAASDPELARVDLTLPDNTCCDRYVYQLTITYEHGAPLRIATVDGVDWPPPVRHLLSVLVS